MALNFSIAAYGFVVAGGLALLVVGHPVGEAPPSPITPGLKAAAALPAAASPAASSIAAAGFTLTSTSVDLPNSARIFPAGPGVELVQQNCAACHSVGMVMNQPGLSPAAWEGEVAKMRAVYKAPVAAADVPAIVAYLTSVKGLR